MLKIDWIGDFCPFDFLACPECGGRDFVSISGSAVFCDTCNTRFSVRPTAGDPGCVVDAFLEKTYGKIFQCSDCRNEKTVRYSKAKLSVTCSCGKNMEWKYGYSGPLNDKNRESYYYYILKTGDYASGWIRGGGNALDHEYIHGSSSAEAAAWNAFQEGKAIGIIEAAEKENRDDFHVGSMDGHGVAWRVVGETMPDPGVWVLLYNGFRTGVGQLKRSSDGINRNGWKYETTEEVGVPPTHWMPLPTVPSGKIGGLDQAR